jgi:hypothetical protein
LQGLIENRILGRSFFLVPWVAPRRIRRVEPRDSISIVHMKFRNKRLRVISGHYEELDQPSRFFAVSERHACHVGGIARGTKRRSSGCSDENLLSKIHEPSDRYPRFGYRKIFDRLKLAGWRFRRDQVPLLRRRERIRVPQKAV